MSSGVALIRELPADERPRERLLSQGPQSLGDAELLAVLLRTGRPGASAIDLARDLLRQAGGLAALAALPPARMAARGLGGAKAASVAAAVEIGRRLARTELVERVPLGRPAAVASYLALRYARRDQEVFGALYLDTRHRLLAERELYRGTVNRTAVEPREILKEGLLAGATACLLFHTHPSGDPSPSAEDLAFTRRVAEACEVVGVKLLDHLILGGVGRWVSLAERGGF
jgi:DNA repair protein RadC